MATLVLSIAGSAAGAAIGGPIGAQVGGAIGAMVGGVIDQKLFAPLAEASGQTSIQEGPRLADVKLGSSTEGTPLPRVYGRIRLPGLLIWATRFREETHVTTQTTGGGQTGSGKNFVTPTATDANGSVKTIEYLYFANVAYAVSEGPITRVGRIWAEGRELNQSKFNFRAIAAPRRKTRTG